MLIIRFSRVGKKNHAQYKVVVAEKSFPVKGKFIEQLGSYDPHLKVSSLKGERINYWIENGAACSDSAFNLFVREGIIEGEKRQIKIKEKKKDENAEGEEKAEVKEDGAKEETPVKEEVKEEKKEEAPVKEEVKEEKVEEKKEETPAKEEVKEEKKEETPAKEEVKEEKKEEVKEEKSEEKKEEK